MGFYNDSILPKLCDLERVIGATDGRMLEIGIGSGLHLPFYRPVMAEVLAIEPAARSVSIAHHFSQRADVPVSFLEASAEAIPLDDHSVDTVVTTWALCTISGPITALGEMRRVFAAGRQAPVRRARPCTRQELAPMAGIG